MNKPEEGVVAPCSTSTPDVQALVLALQGKGNAKELEQVDVAARLATLGLDKFFPVEARVRESSRVTDANMLLFFRFGRRRMLCASSRRS
jgi:hypothetical protein